jgi:hypothetical protein
MLVLLGAADRRQGADRGAAIYWLVRTHIVDGSGGLAGWRSTWIR